MMFHDPTKGFTWFNQDMTNEDYHAHDGVSRSGIVEFLKSPYHFHERYIKKSYDGKRDVSAINIGSALHTLALEPEKFKSEFAIEPNYDARTKEGKAIRDNFKESAGNRIIIDANDFNTAELMAANLNSTQKELLKNLAVENSFFWTDPHTGIIAKCRPDAYCADYIVDIKTTRSANPHSFQRSIVDYGYHIQAGMMKEGLRAHGIDIQKFIFIIIENTAPYATATYILDDFAINKGIEIYKNCLLKMRECIISDAWPSYDTQVISLPAWAS